MRNKKYIYIWDYKNNDFPFQIFIGARGTGKTFGALDGAINGEIDGKFILMRRTAQEHEILLDSETRGEGANPFKSVNRVTGRNIGMKKIVNNLSGIYDRVIDPDTKINISKGDPIGYGVALSTIASIRGIDFAECTDIIYDEFIPERHVKKIKDEGVALLNAYESINRNREIEGGEPMRLWLLANSNDIYNAIFIELDIIEEAEQMINTGRNHKYFTDRGLALHIINNNKQFIEEKSKTALYKLTKDSKFYKMALNNAFSFNDFSGIAKRSIKGFVPVVGIKANKNIFIYRKKGERDIYCTFAKSKCDFYDITKEDEKRRFSQNYYFALNRLFVEGKLTFETFEIKQIILDLIL